jgi:hypothetical protein
LSRDLPIGLRKINESLEPTRGTATSIFQTAYNPFIPFQLCTAAQTPIYAGSGEAVVKGRCSGASYKEEL